jgi:hypothetical protein
MTRGGESLHNELPGAEKPEVLGTKNPKVPKTEVSKKKKNPKILSRAELRKFVKLKTFS